MTDEETRQFWSMIFEQRLLVFLEYSDGFRQVALNPTQFKAVSDAVIQDILGKADIGGELVQIAVLDTPIIPKKVFENLNSIHEE